jgi:hypothetical protein
MRQLGRSMLFTVGDYEGSYADYRTAFRSRDLLDTLFAPYDHVLDPATEFMGSPWVEVHYARHRGPIDSTTRYLILPATRQAPPDFTLLVADSNAALFVRDTSQWKAMRYAPYNVRTRSALYDIPRESMLRDWGEPACAFDFDLKVLLGRAASHECPPGSTAHPSTP